MTRVVISQPMYFPWVGFMAQMSLADVYIWLDDVQFSKGSFTNRVQIKSKRGKSWLSIPLKGAGSFQMIHSLTTLTHDWRGRHRALLAESLNGLPYISEALSIFDRTMINEHLIDLLIASAENLASSLGILPGRILRSSDLGINGSSWHRVLEIVRAVGGATYVTGHGAIKYLDHEAFENAGVNVEYMEYAPTPWFQSHGDFTPYVTTLDLVAAVGHARAVEHLRPRTVHWREFQANVGVV